MSNKDIPGELITTKVTVAGGLGVDGLEEIQLLDDDTGAEIEVLLDDGEDLGIGLGAGTVGVDEDGGRLGNTNGVRELDEGTAGEASGDDGLGDPATGVGSRAIDLGPILTRESSTIDYKERCWLVSRARRNNYRMGFVDIPSACGWVFAHASN